MSRPEPRRSARGPALGLCGALALAAVQCDASLSTADGGCQLSDLNGTNGGRKFIDLTASDTAFSVGGPDSGSTSSNAAFENGATVTVTLFNVGTRPHDFAVQCQPPNPDNCEMRWCFPAQAAIPPVAPGSQATATFVAPLQEGVYVFTSDVDGDVQTAPDGGVTGLVGELVVM